MTLSDDISISSAEDCTTLGRRGSFAIGNGTGVVTTSRSKGVHSESAWVKRTYCMVNEANQTQPNVLSWSIDGEAFEIKDIDALKNDLFRKYHGDTKFESFTRRLRRYGFHRVRLEPLTKTTGRHSNAVLAFRHESFRRDRHDLLANLAIVSQANESQNAPEDNLTCTNNTIARIEKTQAELTNTIKEFENHMQEQKRRIDHLRQESISKDQTIRSLEFRLERLENNLLMATGPAQRQPAASTWALNNPLAQVPRLQTQPTMAGASSTLLMPSQPLKAPLFTLISSQSLKRVKPSLEREISAFGLLPFLDDLVQEGGSLFDDEPTLPRSKMMKLYHKSAHDIFDGIALSRQTTPIF